MRIACVLALVACGEVEGKAPTDSRADPDTAPADTNNCTRTTVGYTPIANENVLSAPGRGAAQTITLADQLFVDEIQLPLSSCKSNGVVDARVIIHPTTGGLAAPDSTNTIAVSPVVPSSAILGACVGGMFELATFTFSPPVTLDATVVYAVSLQALGSVGGALSWRRSSTPTDPADPYAGGTNWSESGTDIWVSGNTNLDLAFEISGNVCE